ncbi:hypothetical protein EVAR_41933_1 [Eumeta japonica]|uniref:Uncharacterized protein n=1 Tax=Eumeta variegata TaxID=151549 RepID=A0A4C1XMB0_EUMVA|nr:hypothetical protein EVAR_41933_1 [Eumeta japonica]
MQYAVDFLTLLDMCRYVAIVTGQEICQVCIRSALVDPYYRLLHVTPTAGQPQRNSLNLVGAFIHIQAPPHNQFHVKRAIGSGLDNLIATQFDKLQSAPSVVIFKI